MPSKTVAKPYKALLAPYKAYRGLINLVEGLISSPLRALQGVQGTTFQASKAHVMFAAVSDRVCRICV